MKMPVAVWPVIVVLLAACHEQSPTAPELRQAGTRAEAVHVSGIQQVSVGSAHACSLDAAGVISCWGSDQAGQASPIDGQFVQVSAGESHTCALERGGTIACWGSNDSGESAPPNGSFSQVSVGDPSCGLRRNGSVVCWGRHDEAQQTTVPEGRYIQVTVGQGYVCALREGATAVCWGWYPGWDDDGVPVGRFAQLEAGLAHVCGLRLNGTLTCWGENASGESYPPAGVFTQVTAGWGHSCAVAADSTVACWGNDDAGQATPPAGKFTQVSAGWRYTCGVRTDGTSVCWGEAPANLPDPYPLVPLTVSGSGTITDEEGHQLHFSLNVTLDPERGSAPTGVIRFRVPDAGVTFTSSVIYSVGGIGDWVQIRGAGPAIVDARERVVEFVIHVVDGSPAGADAFAAELWAEEFSGIDYYSGDEPSPLDKGKLTIRRD